MQQHDHEDVAASRSTPASINSVSRTFRSADGLELRADAWGCEDDPPVLLLHGGGQTRHSWTGTARDLAAAGRYAVCVDMRGHGESDWCPNGDYRHDDFGRDTDVLARSFSRPPVIVGASLGGISALLALGEAAEAGEEPIASALILVDIAVRMEADGAQRIMQFMMQRPDGFESLEEVADAISSYNPHRPRPRDLSGLNKNLRRGEDGRYRWHWDPRFLEGRNRGEGERRYDPTALERAARGLTVPTLLVRGRLSDLLSAEGAQEFLEMVPHSKFADVSEAGHMVAGDRNDVFTRAVLDFLENDLDEA